MINKCHESKQLNALLGKTVRIVFFDDDVLTGELDKSGFGDRYQISHKKGVLTFRKTHVKRVELLSESGKCVQMSIPGLPKKDTSAIRLKRRWENGFQRWSDKQSQDGTHPRGKCGYSSICDYCTDPGFGRPCVRALNQMLKETGKELDYSKIDYDEVWRMSNE